MKKNRLAFYLVLTIILINISNIVFILISLRGPEQYFKQVLTILIDYFMGFHTILFGLFIFVLLVFQLLKKTAFQKILHISVIVFLLFVVSFNLALFPLLNQASDHVTSPLLTRKLDGSLNEAIRSSPASYADRINEYKEIDLIMKNRIFVTPLTDPLKDDSYFKFFVKPARLVKKSYDFILTEEEYEKIRKKNYKVIRAFLRTGKIYAYLIFQGVEDSPEIYIFIHGRFCLFVPGQMAKEYI